MTDKKRSTIGLPIGAALIFGTVCFLASHPGVPLLTGLLSILIVWAGLYFFIRGLLASFANAYHEESERRLTEVSREVCAIALEHAAHIAERGEYPAGRVIAAEIRKEIE